MCPQPSTLNPKPSTLHRLATLRTDSPPLTLKADTPRDDDTCHNTSSGGAAVAAGGRGAAAANATEGQRGSAPRPKRKIRRRSLTPRINQVLYVYVCVDMRRDVCYVPGATEDDVGKGAAPV